MDCIFNKQIPKSTSSCYIVRPSSKTFINGIAMSYSDQYDQDILEQYLSQREFEAIMESINDTLETFFPCTFCFCFGYLCCPLTLGLSFLIPSLCISDAKNELKLLIKKINEEKLRNRNIYIVFKMKCSTSWLEFQLINEDEINQKLLNTISALTDDLERTQHKDK